MADATRASVWGMRALYVALALLLLFVHLLPIETGPARIAGPDLLVAMTFAWALRRPTLVPMLAVAAVMLLADLVLMRPPGLWAALVLMATEWLKAQDRRVSENTFVAEWLTVAAVLLFITVVYRVVLGVLIVAPGGLSLYAMQYGTTLLAYPLVVAAGSVLFGVRRIAPGDYTPLRRGS